MSLTDPRLCFALWIGAVFFIALLLEGMGLAQNDKLLQQEKLAQRDKYSKLTTDCRARGEWKQGIQAAEQMLQVERELFGSVHADVIGSLRQLATMRAHLGEFPSARKNLEELLKLTVELHGQQHWRVGDAQLALVELEKQAALTDAQRGKLAEAEVLEWKGLQLFREAKYREAIPVHKQVLELRRQVLGQANSAYAASLNSLGQSHLRLEDLSEALRIFRQAVDLREKVLGKGHPETAFSLSEQAVAHFKLKDYAAALPLHKRSLEIREESFGRDHSATAYSLMELGTTHQRLGDSALRREDFPSAREHYDEYVALRRRRFGPQHWQVTDAQLLRKQVDVIAALSAENRRALQASTARWESRPKATTVPEHKQAVELAREVLAVRERILGADNYQTLLVKAELGFHWNATADWSAAISVKESLLEPSRQVYGEMHPAFATRLNNLAYALQQKGDSAKAMELYRRAIEIRKALFGAEDKSYRLYLENLLIPVVATANSHAAKSEWKQSTKFREEALAIQEALLGSDHWNTSDARATLLYERQLAALTEKQSEEIRRADALEATVWAAGGISPALARTHLEECLKIRTQILGTDSIKVAHTANFLGVLYTKLGLNDLAKAQFRQAARIAQQTFPGNHPQLLQVLNNLASVCDDDEAETLLTRIHETAGEHHGEVSKFTRDVRYRLAQIHLTKNQFAKADAVFKRPIAKLETSLVNQHADLLKIYDDATELFGQFAANNKALIDPDTVVAYHQRRLDIICSAKDKSPAREIDARSDLTSLYESLNQTQLARESAALCCDLCQRLGEGDSQAVKILLQVANWNLGWGGEKSRSLELAEQALAIQKRISGDRNVATVEPRESVIYYLRVLDREDPTILPKQREILEILEAAHGKDSSELIKPLNAVAMGLRGSRKFAEAVPLHQRALEIALRAHGEDHHLVLNAYSDLESVYSLMGDKAQSAVYALKRIEFERKSGGVASALPKNAAEEGKLRLLAEQARDSYGAEDQRTLLARQRLAAHYARHGSPESAEATYREVIAVSKRTVGEHDRQTLDAMTEFGVLLAQMRRYADAEPLLRAVVDRQTQGFDRAEYRAMGYQALSWLVGAYRFRNLQDEKLHKADQQQLAGVLLARLNACKQYVGEKSDDAMRVVDDLAMIYEELEDYAEAEKHYLRYLEIAEAEYGPSHFKTLTYLNCLARCYANWTMLRNDDGLAYKKGEQAQLKLLEVYRKVHGEDSLEVTAAIANLGGLHSNAREYAKAEKFQQDVLVRLEERLGKDHWSVESCLQHLISTYSLSGEPAKAEKYQLRWAEIAMQKLETAAAGQSERQQLANLAASAPRIDSYLSLAVANPASHEQAADLVVRWKGAVFRRQRQLQAIRNLPDGAAAFGELQKVVNRLSTEAFRNPPPAELANWRKSVVELTSHKERLEADLMLRSKTYRDTAQPTTVTQIRDALPANARLICFWNYYYYGTRYAENDRERLVGIVLQKNQPVRIIPLGSSQAIRERIAQWLGKDATRQTRWQAEFGVSAESRQAGLQLRNELWEPFAPYLKDAGIALISTEEITARIPWGALPGSTPDRLLLEEMAVVAVPNLQALAEANTQAVAASPVSSAQDLLLIGDVDYAKSASSTDQPPQLAANDLRGIEKTEYQRLAGTRAELSAIKSLHARHRAQTVAAGTQAGQTVLSNDQANEAEFRRLAHRHRHLHLATHGFFAGPQYRSAMMRSLIAQPIPQPSRYLSGSSSVLLDPPSQNISDYHPALLSGIVLAGANQPAADGDDGILTAAEVQTLDLRGVELVTLSACETGLGQSAGGEGLLGLQRAFQVAGAKNVVASLWKVDDAATQALMTEFYTNLWQKNLPAVEALRQAQLRMIVDYTPTEGKLRAGFAEKPIDEKTLAEARARQQADGKLLPPFYWAGFVISGNGK